MLGFALEELERRRRRGPVVHVEGDEAHWRRARQTVEEVGDGRGQIAEVQRGVRREACPQRVDVHLEVAPLVEVGMVPVIDRRWHACPSVEAVDLAPYARRLGHLRSDSGEVRQPRAAGDADLDERYGGEASRTRDVRGFQGAERV